MVCVFGPALNYFIVAFTQGSSKIVDLLDI
jgi:hypothetical protein